MEQNKIEKVKTEQNKIKVLIADDTVSYGVPYAKELHSWGFHVVTCKRAGSAVLNSMTHGAFDVVVVDVNLPDTTAVELLKAAQMLSNRPKFIVTSCYENDFLRRQVLKSGASYFLSEPFDFATLHRLISDLTSRSDSATRCIEVQVTDALHKLGVPARLKGYYYLRTAVLLTIRDEMMSSNLTNNLYSQIAEKYDITVERVERAMRHAIDVSWGQGDPEAKELYFGHFSHNKKGKPTNLEYVAVLADRLRLQTQSDDPGTDLH